MRLRGFNNFSFRREVSEAADNFKENDFTRMQETRALEGASAIKAQETRDRLSQYLEERAKNNAARQAAAPSDSTRQIKPFQNMTKMQEATQAATLIYNPEGKEIAQTTQETAFGSIVRETRPRRRRLQNLQNGPTPTPDQALKAQVSPQIKQFDKAQILTEVIERANTAKQAETKADISQFMYKAPFEAKLSNKSAADSAGVFMDAFEKQAKRNKKIAILGLAALSVAGITTGVIRHIKNKGNKNSFGE